ncbi:LuxR C-terminal-related transcriptional regulator [Nocardioides convexus]|uniref:helix-turn-helix transcriptional regulator n=1 Tax=Nocardioides convexus TaxID=2712224 RepID=UPI0024182BF0|nr:LuxR C-terminal-related transcriptional regulator [Nocardioides convexus]
MLYPWGDSESPDALGGRLAELGLDTNAERVYRTLLADPEADRETIRDAIGISEPDLGDALNRLAALALVHDARDAQPRLINPDAALTALLAQYESDIASRKVRLEESRMAIGQLLEARHAAAPDSLDIERVIGLDAVRRRIEDLSQRCSHTIWSFNPGGAQSAENLRRSRPLNQGDPGPRHPDARGLPRLGPQRRGDRRAHQLAERPRRRGAGDPHPSAAHDRRRQRGRHGPARRRLRAGGDGRHGPRDGDGPVGTVHLHLAHVQALRPAPAPRARPTNEQEMQALRLWAQGRTDRAVANALGVSERTVRRMAESINARLGARSRFEAGVRARDTGLLTSEDLL